MGYTDLVDLIKRVQWSRDILAAKALWEVIDKLGMRHELLPYTDEWMREITYETTAN